MLIREKQADGYRYPQITEAPTNNYAAFLNFFRGGHTIDDNLGAIVVAATPQARMLESAIASGYLTKTHNNLFPVGLADIVLTKSGLQLIQTTLDQTFCELAVAKLERASLRMTSCTRMSVPLS